MMVGPLVGIYVYMYVVNLPINGKYNFSNVLKGYVIQPMAYVAVSACDVTIENMCPACSVTIENIV